MEFYNNNEINFNLNCKKNKKLLISENKPWINKNNVMFGKLIKIKKDNFTNYMK